MQFEVFALKTNVFAFASRSEVKVKPRRRIFASPSTRTLPIGERKWTDIEPEDYSPIAYPVSKQLSTLLRHGHLPREEDGAIEFWRSKDCLRCEFENSQHWSDEMWKSTMAKGGGHKKRCQYCTDSSGQEILYLRALHGHPIDPTLQDNVLIPDDFFEYIYHIGCAINLHSLTKQGSQGRSGTTQERRHGGHTGKWCVECNSRQKSTPASTAHVQVRALRRSRACAVCTCCAALCCAALRVAPRHACRIVLHSFHSFHIFHTFHSCHTRRTFHTFHTFIRSCVLTFIRSFVHEASVTDS